MSCNQMQAGHHVSPSTFNATAVYGDGIAAPSFTTYVYATAKRSSSEHITARFAALEYLRIHWNYGIILN